MLDLLSHPLLLNPWIKAGIILIGFYVISQVIYLGIVQYILHLTKKTKTDVDDKIIQGTNKAVALLLLSFGVQMAFKPLSAVYGYIAILEKIATSVSILIITYIVIVIADILIEAWGTKITQKTESKVDDQILGLFHRFSRIALALIGIMFILPVWGIQIGPLLASLGIAGIAIAFALQATLSNIFGGASLLVDKAVKAGDFIELENGMVGEVLEVGLRSTRLKNNQNEVIVIPSGKLADMRLINYSPQEGRLRVIIPFGVEYGSDVEKVKEVALKAVGKVESILTEPAPEAHFISMGDFALNFQVRFWISSFNEKFIAKSQVNEQLYKELAANGIGIPFPTRTIYMRGENK